MRYNLNSGWGQLEAFVAASGIHTFGRILVVMPSTDANFSKWGEIANSGIDPDGFPRLFTTYEAAYAAAITNSNDVILLGANGSHNVSDTIAWSKNRIHTVGLDGGYRHSDQGSKIVMPDAVPASGGAVIKITGIRNDWRNVKIINNNSRGAALYGVIFGGEGTMMKNCSIMHLSHLADNKAADVVMGEDSGTFIDCEFGFDTLAQTDTRTTMLFDSTIAGARAKDNYFKDCTFKSCNTRGTQHFITVADGNSVLFTNFFDNCGFLSSTANGGAVATDAVLSNSSLADGQLLFRNPFTNATNFCSGVTTNVKVMAPASSANAFEGVTPS